MRNRQCLWFIIKEGVCRERSTDVHDLTKAQPSFSIAMRVFLVFQKKVFLTFGCKIIAKLIHDTENLYNFVFGNRRLYSFLTY